MSMFKKLFLFPIYCYGENALDQSLGMKMFIKQSNREAAAYQDPDEPLAVHDYSFEDYRRLKMKLTCLKVGKCLYLMLISCGGL